MLPAPADTHVILAMRALGATSPAYARPLHDLPPEIAERLPELVDRGLVREGAPGTYYLYVSTGAAEPRTLQPMPVIRRSSWGRLLAVFLFWLLIILLPIAYLQLTARR